jgi:hypothetical protein
MDFWLGLAAGIIATLLLGVLAVYFFVRDSSPPLVHESTPPDGRTAVTVMMIESFLNQQMRDALGSETVELEHEAERATQARVPLKIKLREAALDIQDGRRAEFAAQLTASAWGLNLDLRPVTELQFVPQEGRVKIVVRRVRVRGLTVPRSLIDSFVNEVVETAEAKLNHSLAELQRDTNVTLTDIESTDDLLILKFA